MYRCIDCGSVFDEPTTVEDQVAFYGSAPYIEIWDACPYCESTEIVEYYEDADDLEEEIITEEDDL